MFQAIKLWLVKWLVSTLDPTYAAELKAAQERLEDLRREKARIEAENEQLGQAITILGRHRAELDQQYAEIGTQVKTWEERVREARSHVDEIKAEVDRISDSDVLNSRL